MLSYSRSFTYAPISAIYRFQGQYRSATGWAMWAVLLGGRTCFTLTITKLSTSGYFSSGRCCVRPSSTQICRLNWSSAHRRIDNSSATSWRLLLTRCWSGRDEFGWEGGKDAAERAVLGPRFRRRQAAEWRFGQSNVQCSDRRQQCVAVESRIRKCEGASCGRSVEA